MYIRATTAAAAGVAGLILGSSLARPSIRASFVVAQHCPGAASRPPRRNPRGEACPRAICALPPLRLGRAHRKAQTNCRRRASSPEQRPGAPGLRGPNVPHCTTGLADRLVPRAITVAPARRGVRTTTPLSSIPLQLAQRGRLPGRRQLVGFRSRRGRGIFSSLLLGELAEEFPFPDLLPRDSACARERQVSRKGIFRTHSTRR